MIIWQQLNHATNSGSFIIENNRSCRQTPFMRITTQFMHCCASCNLKVICFLPNTIIYFMVHWSCARVIEQRVMTTLQPNSELSFQLGWRPHPLHQRSGTSHGSALSYWGLIKVGVVIGDRTKSNRHTLAHCLLDSRDRHRRSMDTEGDLTWHLHLSLMTSFTMSL